MDHKTTADLMRLLLGELSAADAERLWERMASQPGLRQVYEQLERQWQSLELQEPQPAPPGYSTRVVTRAKEQAKEGLAPAWWVTTLAGKAATVVVLAGGIAVGAVLAAAGETEDWSEFAVTEPSMAESYLVAVDESENEAWLENGS